MAVRRINYEFKHLETEGRKHNFFAVPNDGDESPDVFKKRVMFIGPKNTPYENGIFHLKLRFPEDYPFKPFKMSFITKIYHCNVNGRGEMCTGCDGIPGVCCAKGEWGPMLTVSKTLSKLISILKDPIVDSHLSPEIATLYQTNRKEYDRIARQWTLEHADPIIEPADPIIEPAVKIVNLEIKYKLGKIKTSFSLNHTESEQYNMRLCVVSADSNSTINESVVINNDHDNYFHSFAEDIKYGTKIALDAYIEFQYQIADIDIMLPVSSSTVHTEIFVEFPSQNECYMLIKRYLIDKENINYVPTDIIKLCYQYYWKYVVTLIFEGYNNQFLNQQAVITFNEANEISTGNHEVLPTQNEFYKERFCEIFNLQHIYGSDIKNNLLITNPNPQEYPKEIKCQSQIRSIADKENVNVTNNIEKVTEEMELFSLSDHKEDFQEMKLFPLMEQHFTDATLSKKDIIKEGWMKKKSKHIKVWRLRWIVLTNNKLYTFKRQNDYQNATETISLSSITSTGKDGNMFTIKSNNSNMFQFKTDTNLEAKEWRDELEMCQSYCIRIPIRMQCVENQRNDILKFYIYAPYGKFSWSYYERKRKIKKKAYLMEQLVDRIMDYPQKIYPSMELLYIESDDEKDEKSYYTKCLQDDITIYSKHKLETIGLKITTTLYRNIKIPTNVICKRNPNYSHSFELSVEYHIHSLKQVFDTMMEQINSKYEQIPFFIKTITADSFIAKEFIGNNFDSLDLLSQNLVKYSIKNIKEKGLTVIIDIKIYQHRGASSNNNKICDNMKTYNDLCPIYASMRYQHVFSEKSLNHLYECRHFKNEFIDKPECKYGNECYSYKRLSGAGNQISDRCHVKLFRHPPRYRRFKSSEELNSFCLNSKWFENASLYHPNEEDKKEYEYTEKDGYLLALITEIVANGFKSDLCLTPDDEKNNNYTLLNIVNEKLNCLRHKIMGSPLNKSDMLSVLLYTGGESNYDLCKSQRKGNYIKWKWFDYCLNSAINKLSKRESGYYKIYTGLTGTKLKQKSVECGYFKTFVSTSCIKEIALTFVKGDGMIFEIDENFRKNCICCDVSWISKFDNEYEILIARSIDAVFNNFKCKISDDEIDGIQTVLLSSYDQ